MNKSILEGLQEQKGRLVQFDRDENIKDEAPGFAVELNEFGEAPRNLETLYENTISWIRGMLAEVGISEDTLSTAAPLWTTFMLPLIRRFYHNIVARELVSVQPIPQPTAYVYYLNKTYTHTAAGITAGQRTDQQTPTAYAASGEQAALIRELQMNLQRKLIECLNYKLKADWTLEAEQDWRSQHKLSVQDEMISEVADEIAREVDRLIINALIAGVAHTVNWNPAGYRTGDVNISLYRHAYEAEIYHSLLDAEAWILQNKRGSNDPAIQWNVVMNATNWARFKKLESWNIATIENNKESGIGRRYEGIINGKFHVYLSPEMSNCNILMTIKKDWKFATGYYCPYIPLYTSPKYIINDDFTQFARGAMSRFAYGVVPETYNGTTNNGLVLINLCVS